MILAKIGEENLFIFSGKQTTLPDQDTFEAGFSQTTFNLASGTQPSFIQFPVAQQVIYTDPDYIVKNYSISDNGFLQLEGLASQTGLDNSGFGILTGQSIFVNGEVKSAVYNYGAGNFAIAFSSVTAAINDGVVSTAMVIDAFDNVPVPFSGNSFAGSYHNTFGPIGYGITSSSNNGGDTMASIAYDNSGSVEVKQIITDPNTYIIYSTAFNGSRYISMGLDGFNAPFIFDWLPTDLLDPEDCVVDSLNFDDSIIDDNILGGVKWYCDGLYFYGLIDRDSTFNPIAPYIVKIPIDLSGYILINISAGDNSAQLFLSDVQAGTFYSSFAYSDIDGYFMFTGGLPANMRYFTTNAPPPYNLQLHPFGLNCQNYCLPLFKR